MIYTQCNRPIYIYLLPNENITITIDTIKNNYSINGHQKHFIYFCQHISLYARNTYLNPVCMKWSNCKEIDLIELKQFMIGCIKMSLYYLLKTIVKVKYFCYFTLLHEMEVFLVLNA